MVASCHLFYKTIFYCSLGHVRTFLPEERKGRAQRGEDGSATVYRMLEMSYLVLCFHYI